MRARALLVAAILVATTWLCAPTSAQYIRATAPDVLTTSTTQTCTAANTTETDLWTYSLPANTLSVNGRGVRVTVWGTTAATANNKTARMYLGSQTLGTSGPSAFNNTAWHFTVDVLRSGAATQSTRTHKQVSGGAVNDLAFVAGTQDLTAAVVIKVTGQNGTAAANDICVRGAIVELLRF